MSSPMCSSGGMKNIRTNPDHNIWNNNGTFWCHYTVHNDNHTKERVRVSLGTRDVAIARALRDFIMDATPKIAARIPRSTVTFAPGHRAVAARHECSAAA